MKKKIMVSAALFMAMTMATTTMAAVWRTGDGANQNRWWLDDGNGSYASNEWRWVDGDSDGVAECYAFDRDGWMYANTTTPDGYQVNGDGAWTVNGVVQTRQTGTGTQVAADSQKNPRILVAYYSLPETGGTDTDSGASRVATGNGVQGNVEYMANTIAQTTGGDLFRIDTVQSYPTVHEPLVNRANSEQSRNARPALSTHIDHLDDYDVIFVGYPIWWSEMPMAMYSFFDEYNFGGKTIIPFSSHGGSGFSGTPSEIRRLEPEATVMNGYTVSRGNVAGDRENLKNWVNSLNLQ